MSTAWKPYEHVAFPLNSVEQEEWYAVHCRSRHEKKVEMELQYKGIETFLPVTTKARQWSDRKVNVEFPLFPSYIFVRMAWSPANHLKVLKTNGVVTLLGNSGKPTAIPEYQIESTRKLICGNMPFEEYSYLKIGQRVRVRSGALEGVEGVLLATDGGRKLVVSIDLIRQSLAISLKGYEVEAVQESMDRVR